ncbi:extracellular solute-binding protein [Paenibacillus sp. LMG 31460]|uniref:Extracellular solute-binding protein n=1 Tax=Paenibacillus germinis TaxID=2654979 RepID=A0ABX1Z5R8_9BACL|nr:sugar ABC transporter substrate-binding protein [Paenibacillus germinis]NOU88725.1 extracellular solute-binding protein [Paenibacillus germinis]
MSKKWARHIIFLIVIGLLVIGFGSVQPATVSKGTVTETSNKKMYEGIKLKSALIGGGTYESLYEAIPKFEQETGAKVEIIFKDNNYNLDKKLTTDFTANKIDYDVISTHSNQISGYSDALEPLDHLFTEDDLRDFSPSILNAGKIDAKPYMIPRLADISVYYYRTDLFHDEANKSKFKTEYNYDLTPPQTLEQLKDISIFFAKQGKGLSGTQFAGKEEAMTGRFMELTQAFGGDFLDEKKNVILNQTGGLKAAQYLRDLYAAGAMPKGVVNFLWDEVENNFANGKIAIYSEWPGWYSTLDDPKSSKVAGKFDVVRAPEGPSGIHPGWGGVHGFAVTKASKHKEAAAALIKFLTNAENMTNESKLGATPVRISVWEQVLSDAKTGDERKQNFYNTLNTALKEDFRTPPPIKQWIPLSNILYPYLQKIIVGDMSPQEGLNAAASEITKMLELTR